TFNDPDTGQPFPAWVEYYRDLGIPIPEGEPGLNPGGMSRSPHLDIVYAYGRPAGWRKPHEESTTSMPSSQPHTLLNVMTYNIRYGTAPDGDSAWDLRKDGVVELIRARMP